jgi:inosine-uridine nucleoside N-ribohydrolase
MKPIPVILDTDIGSDIDDTWALAALLHSPELQPLLITTTSGDTVYRAQLTSRLLEVAHRTDIPLGIGLFHGTMEEQHRHQGPWAEGANLDAYRGPLHRDGVDALIRTVRSAKEPVTLISIAPSFNIAKALDIAPDIAAKCHFVGMHGSIDRGYGPTSPAEPETNVRMDVPGFRKVLAAPWLSIRITPLDTCGQVILDGSRFAQLRDSAHPVVRACMENYRIWAKRVDWMTVDYEEHRSSVLFDNVAVFMAYSTRFIDWECFPIEVSDDGMTRRAAQGRPVNVAMRWNDLDAFRDHITQRILGEPS